jgi:hypothetical protein
MEIVARIKDSALFVLWLPNIGWNNFLDVAYPPSGVGSPSEV